VPRPIAVGTPSEPDAYDLFLLLPGGPALAARGSVSGVQSRFVNPGFVAPPSATSTQVLEGPDLAGCLYSYTGSFGSRYYGAWIKNRGTSLAGANLAEVSSSDRYGKIGKSLIVPPLAPGQVWGISVLSLSEGLPFPFPWTLSVDIPNRVAGSNEANNTVTASTIDAMLGNCFSP
jgi:hypothetical protein